MSMHSRMRKECVLRVQWRLAKFCLHRKRKRKRNAAHKLRGRKEASAPFAKTFGPFRKKTKQISWQPSSCKHVCASSAPSIFPSALSNNISNETQNSAKCLSKHKYQFRTLTLLLAWFDYLNVARVDSRLPDARRIRQRELKPANCSKLICSLLKLSEHHNLIDFEEWICCECCPKFHFTLA